MNKQRLFWMVFILLISRTIFAALFQGVLSLGSNLSGEELNYLEAGRWWTVYGSLIDIGCLILMVWVLRTEGAN